MKIGLTGAGLRHLDRMGARPANRYAGLAVAFLILFAASPLAGASETKPARPRAYPVALADLVKSGDPLAGQGLKFDARLAQHALEAFDSGKREGLAALGDEPAAQFIFRHATHFYNDITFHSAREFVLDLLKDVAPASPGVATCRESLGYFSGPMLDDPHWVADTLAYLPREFRFRGTLFLTFGYDIGVALAPDASLNGAYKHFGGHSRELVYYAIHELHHVGFMTYQPPLRVDSLKTWADVAGFVRYATQLEGMAVWAAYGRRQAEGALDGDKDYVALRDAERMAKDEAAYFALLNGLKARPGVPSAADVSATLDSFSQNERLWYRVGAMMARRIEEARGRESLVGLIKGGPEPFMETYLRLNPGPTKSGRI